MFVVIIDDQIWFRQKRAQFYYLLLLYYFSCFVFGPEERTMATNYIKFFIGLESSVYKKVFIIFFYQNILRDIFDFDLVIDLLKSSTA